MEGLTESGVEVEREPTTACVGTEEPAAIKPDGHLLHFLSMLLYVLGLTRQVIRKLTGIPKSCFMACPPKKREITHQPAAAWSDAIKQPPSSLCAVLVDRVFYRANPIFIGIIFVFGWIRAVVRLRRVKVQKCSPRSSTSSTQDVFGTLSGIKSTS